MTALEVQRRQRAEAFVLEELKGSREYRLADLQQRARLAGIWWRHVRWALTHLKLTPPAMPAEGTK